MLETDTPGDRVARLERRLKRERRAREEAEWLLEAKSLELYNANNHLTVLANDLEMRVLDRTHELEVSRQQALFLAERDPLTTLANRVSFTRDLEAAIREARVQSGMVQLLFVDLDRFKEINDNYGHAVGDAVLLEVAARLRAICREREVPGRLGGDEFGVICVTPAHSERARQIAADVMEVMSRPIDCGRLQLIVSCSVGFASFPRNAVDSPTLQRFADFALYHSKSAGRSTWTEFDDTMAGELQSRQGLEAELRTAVAAGEIEPWYQPIISTKSNEIVGVEALARWQHAERGLILPGLFIPLAEESSLIVELGRAMIDRCCREMHPFIRDGHLDYVSINLSPRHLRSSSVVEHIAATLAHHHFPPSALQLEITESLLLIDFEQAQECLSRFRALGIRIALDDFGTGYSSLSYIRRLPLDVIKIDRSFARDISADQQAEAVVKAIVQLAQALELRVIAEGVETESQALRLTSCGCFVQQGYLFGRPMPLNEITRYLEARANPTPFAQNISAS
ncbi:putative bifunctional diguanylate cyclase/phosphodiesterase [Phyllobacterium calauticae]|uniref:putative bifunctional diguanylate cyclase/phosphodiesterase n=1 Tax=Phyllobacterium calauticae TaxID=2817027 RepID=UPI001CBFF588|nr:bifunctional diguanylate cyclase/phosphodiesterase [Phyllobacterium calauticae]MBZ3691942.1 bifunctional diguanylate cyclase/phosphodiesterase [Phyllobacterium calauticae]